MPRLLVAAAMSALCCAPQMALAEAGSKTPDESQRRERMRELEARLAEEPSYGETVRMAYRWMAVHPDEIDRVRARLRAKAGAPVLVLAGRYGHGSTTRDVDIGPAAVRDTTDSWAGDQPRGTVMMSWNLPDSVFTPSLIQSYHLTTIQMQVARMVSFLYWYRRHFAIRLYIDRPVDPRARSNLELRIRAYTGLLDVATGGWFSRQLPERDPVTVSETSPPHGASARGRDTQ